MGVCKSFMAILEETTKIFLNAKSRKIKFILTKCQNRIQSMYILNRRPLSSVQNRNDKHEYKSGHDKCVHCNFIPRQRFLCTVTGINNLN